MTFPIPHHRSKITALESENQIARVDQSRERIATGKTADEDLIRFFLRGEGDMVYFFSLLWSKYNTFEKNTFSTLRI